jgi:hypothetical protein
LSVQRREMATIFLLTENGIRGDLSPARCSAG